MSITADALRAGMHLAYAGVYIAVERVTAESAGMVRAFVRDCNGGLAGVVFHQGELLTVAAR